MDAARAGPDDWAAKGRDPAQGRRGSSAPEVPDAAGSQSAVYGVLLLVVAFGPLNFVLYKLMFSVYGDELAFFVSQGVNVMYVIYGALAIAAYSASRAAIGQAPGESPGAGPPSLLDHKFITMGFLDCCGTFFTALGAVHTPGPTQTLLNQALIPSTMIASAIFLGRRFGTAQVRSRTASPAPAARGARSSTADGRVVRDDIVTKINLSIP